MLAISLMRMGAKKRPFYRVVVKEKRSKRDGKYLENVGTYDPLQEPGSKNQVSGIRRPASGILFLSPPSPPCSSGPCRQTKSASAPGP